MTDYKEIAKKYLKLGLNVVPVGTGKIPLRKNHSSSRITPEEIDTFNFQGIGVSTGFISGGLECLDVDSKNSDDPKQLIADLKANIPEKLLKKLVVQRTPSSGLHFIYKTADVESSKKLAMSVDGNVTLETRGLGSYIKVYPSEGYELLQGSLDNIPVISSEERLSILISAKLLNKQIKKDSSKRLTKEQKSYESKFPKYDEDSNIGLELLKKHGWQEHSTNGDWINFVRPDKNVRDGISGGYQTKENFFLAFSTSQDTFDIEKIYDNHSILAELEYNGRYDMMYAELFKKGFGIEGDQEPDSDEELDFLVDVVKENTNLDKAMHGETEIGKSTGWDNIDKHYRHKKNHVTIFLGGENIGKSLFIINMATVANVLHGFKYLICAPENETYVTRKRIIESLAGCSLEELEGDKLLYNKYLKQSRENFFIINNGVHFTLEDVLSMGAKAYERHQIDYLIIDPISFFSLGGTKSEYSHNNDIMSKMLVFAEKYCSIIILAHPNTSSVRENKDGEGFQSAPTRYQMTGGNLFVNRCHDMVVLHRIPSHPDAEIRRTLQFITEKIKNVESGGEVHIKGSWDELTYERKDGHLGFWNGNKNPIYTKKLVGGEIKKSTPEEAF